MHCMSTEGFIDQAGDYDPAGNFNSVSCPACHSVHGEWSSVGPGMIRAVNASELCGLCHVGTHHPSYQVWLGGPHNLAGVECIDCHGYDIAPGDNVFLNHTFVVDPDVACGQSDECHNGTVEWALHQLEEIQSAFETLYEEFETEATAFTAIVMAYNDTADADYDLVSDVRLFHFGYPPIMKLMFRNDGEQLVEVFRRAKETGVTTSLDMALPDPSSAAGRADWVTILKKTLPYVDVFLPSIEEILYMLDRGTYDELYQAAKGPGFLPLITPELLSGMSHKLIEMGVKIVALKLGDRGLYLRTADQSAIEAMGKACPSDPAAWADQELWTTCFKVDVVGTAGSGDATIAGFLSALLRDLSPGEAVTAAVAVGACNVEASDTLSGVRPWDETLRRVASGWARHRQNLDAPGWRFDEARQLWVGQGRS